MKKILLATTALTLTAGMAAAEVKLSASGNMGVRYIENATSAAETVTHSEFAYTVEGSTTTDAGLTFGAKTAQLTSNNGTTGNDGTTVYVKADFGTLSFGSVAEADEIAALPDLGFDGVGMDDLAEAYTGDSSSGIAHNVSYAMSSGPISMQVSGAVGLKSTSAKNSGYAVGAKYTMGGLYLGLGYNQTDISSASTARDGAATTLYFGGSFDAITIAGMATTFDPEVGADESSYGVVATYKVGATSFMLAAGDNDDGKESYGIGFSQNLGGGVTLAGAAGVENEVSQADLGVTFKF